MKKIISIILSLITVFSCALVLGACEKPDPRYELQADGTYFYRQVDTAKEVTVPAEYKGVAITGIAQDGFRGKGMVEKVVLPDTIKTISESAFNGCSSLKKINLEKIETIGKNAFKGTALIIPNLSSVTSLGVGAFSSCSRLSEVTLPSTLTSVPKMAFKSCSYLSIVNLPDSIIEIEDEAFMNCTNLASIDLSNVQYIRAKSFETCSQALKSLTLTNVKEIHDEAFAGCSNLKTVTTGEDCEMIYMHAFRNCALTSFTLGSAGDYWCFLLKYSNSTAFDVYDRNTVGNWDRTKLSSATEFASLFGKTYNYGCYMATKTWFQQAGLMN